MNRTSEVDSSTGVIAEMVRLSIMPQLFVTAIPRPPLMASTRLSMSSIFWSSSPSKVMVKSTKETGSAKSWRGESGRTGGVGGECVVGEYTPVFEHVLRVQLQALAIQPLLRVVVVGAAAVVESGEYVRCVEVRVTARN